MSTGLNGLAEQEDVFENDEALEPIAIIGMTGRFPGAANVEKFWENLRDGVESVRIFTDRELRSQVDEALLKNPNFVGADAVLDDIDLFDAEFFGYTPREAEIMDPQHRLFLECAWEVMELAGYDPETFEGSIGVYAGANMSSYLIRHLARNREFVSSVGSFHTMLGNSQDFLATKVSYKLNLKGPSVNTNTLCSSSMVGVHLGCQALWNYQIDMAMAGGVSIQVTRNEAMFYQEGGIGAFDGHCRAFDSRARGTVSGSGLSIVMLRRLEDALADGDTIHAVIRGSAINNDGGNKMSYTAPSIEGQAAVIAEAQAVGAIDPETISYVETHGTGTSLGDPIEIAGLTKAFRAGTDKKGYCGVGSVKTNIGHLVTAGGVASLIKTVEALKHRQIPPSLNYEKPNPQIDFENSPFYVVTRLTEWQSVGLRRAGVSSFGIGGTNAHLVVEEAPEPEPSHYHRTCHPFPISARSEPALRTAISNLAAFLEAHPELSIGDVAHTLQVGRKAFGYRHFSLFTDREEAVNGLKTLLDNAETFHFQESDDRPVVFMFSGQGVQYPNMARGLYESEPVFREWLDRCAEILAPHLDLREILYPDDPESETAADRLKQTAMTQPALFAVEYALARLWMSWGIQPKAMIGHSIGEYVAACLAGVFSLEDALDLVAARGRMIQDLPPGDMLAVSLSEDTLTPLLDDRLSLAAVNGPARCVVSGTEDGIAALVARLKERKVACTLLHTSHAFHSHMIEPILGEFTARVGNIALNPPEIPYVSNVTGTWMTGAQATDPGYWARHLRGTVRFAQGLQALFEEPGQVLLEVGPGRTLCTLARQHPDKPANQVVRECIPPPRARQSDQVFMLTTLGQLWLSGVRIDWRAYHENNRPRRIPLPTYPFERRRYWIEPDMDSPTEMSRPRMDSLGMRKTDPGDWFYLPTWKRSALPDARGKTPGKHCCLVFLDEAGPGTQLADVLADEGHQVITVSPGEVFAKLEKGIYELRPGVPEDYETLLKYLDEEGNSPQTVVHAWSFVSPAQHIPGPTRFAAYQERGFFSLLFLARALGKRYETESIHLTVIASGLCDLDGKGFQPEKTTLLGPLKIVPREYPNISCRIVDVTSAPKSGWTRERVNLLVTELWAGDRDALATYLGRDRWVRTYEPVHLAPREGQGPREHGVYLVLGGLDGAGLVLAEYLATTVKARLMLTGTEDFPNAEQWNEVLATRPENDPIRCTVEKLLALEAAGAEVETARLDLASETQTRELIETVERRFGRINGVIHAAGAPVREAFRTIVETGRPECEAQFKAKVHGLFCLDTALGNRELDFGVVLTSLSSVLGGLGLAAYTAANCYAEAHVRRHNMTSSVPWLSLAWEFRQAGEMPAGSTPDGLVVQPEECVEVFRGAITHKGYDQLVVSPEDLPARIAWLDRRDEQEPGRKKFTVHPRPNLQNPYKAPSNETERKVAEIWQERLGIEKVGVHDNFFELGGDSLIVVKIRRAMEERFGVDLLTSDLFEHPTVAAVAAYLEQERAGPKLDYFRDRANRQRAALEEEEEELQRISMRRKRYDD